MDERYYFVMDGSRTRSHAQIVTEHGQRLCEHWAGSLHLWLGAEAVLGTAERSARKALALAGLGEASLGEVHAGLSLPGLHGLKERKVLLALPHPFASLTLISDVEAQCLGAHGGLPGAFVSMDVDMKGVVYSQASFRSFGGAPFPSSRGGGAWIGLRLLQTALEAHCGLTARSPLVDQVLKDFENDAHALANFVRHALDRELSAYAPSVFVGASVGDSVARVLAEEALWSFSRLVDAMGLQDDCPLSLEGTLALPLRGLLPQGLRGRLVSPMGDARLGAALAAGFPLSHSVAFLEGGVRGADVSTQGEYELPSDAHRRVATG